MNIPINKNLEEYKNEMVKGFTLREIICLLISLGIIAGAVLILWWQTGLAPDICIYIGLPLGIPTLLLGFGKIQGVTFDVYIKEVVYEKRTRILTYDADELPEENRIFTMQKKRKNWRIGK